LVDKSFLGILHYAEWLKFVKNSPGNKIPSVRDAGKVTCGFEPKLTESIKIVKTEF
jgi:hypothetical protein